MSLAALLVLAIALIVVGLLVPAVHALFWVGVALGVVVLILLVLPALRGGPPAGGAPHAGRWHWRR